MKYFGKITRKDAPLSFQTTFQAKLVSPQVACMYVEMNIPNEEATAIEIDDEIEIIVTFP